MKIQTNTGEVELTADMVRPGMVFQAPGREPYTLHRQIVEFGDWVGSDGMAEKTEYLLDAEVRTFLGCDPAVAAREDVERYGVAPGIDAAAHGFARLRGGGAVDLRREAPRGSVALTPDGVRLIAKHGPDLINDSDDFVGLDARYAGPEDVERLCCLDANRSASGPGGERCTLAIGDHDTHEDIATGTRWAAESDAGIVSVARLRAQLGIRDPACPGCGAANGAQCPDACPDMQRRREEWEAAHCGAHAKPGQRLTSERGEHRPASGDERCTNGKDCNGQHDMAFRGPWGTRWTDDAPLVGCSRCAAPVIPTAGWPPMGLTAQDEAGAYRQGWLCEACAALREALVWRAGRLVPVAMEKPEARHECQRHAAEAPLVALVNTVPEGLDPIGWRAAVLGFVSGTC